MIVKLTREQLDAIADVVWWLKGYQQGSHGSFESCPFDESHLEALAEALRNEKELTYGPPGKEKL